MSVSIRIKRGLEVNLPSLALGELAYTTDTNKLFIGVNQGTEQSPNIQPVLINDLSALNDAMIFKGTLGTSGTFTSLPTTHDVGWTIKVITAGTYAGKVAEIGDMYISLVSREGSNNADTDWAVVQANIDGAVVGPSSSTNNALTVFNGTTGKLVKNSTFIPTTIGGNLINLANPSAVTFPRFNADNTVSSLAAEDFREAIELEDVTNESKATMFDNPTFTGQVVFTPTDITTDEIDFAGPTYRTQGPLSGNVNYSGVNYENGRSVTIRVINGASGVDLTFPAGWRFLGDGPVNNQISIAANKLGVLTLASFGTSESDVVAAWAVET